MQRIAFRLAENSLKQYGTVLSIDPYYVYYMYHMYYSTRTGYRAYNSSYR